MGCAGSAQRGFTPCCGLFSLKQRRRSCFWLCACIPESQFYPHEEVAALLLKTHPENPSALCFAGLLLNDLAMVRHAAEKGHAFAMGWMAVSAYDPDEQFLWTERAANAGDRLGLDRAGLSYSYGFGCTKDVSRGTALHREAALRGLLPGRMLRELFRGDLEALGWTARTRLMRARFPVDRFTVDKFVSEARTLWDAYQKDVFSVRLDVVYRIGELWDEFHPFKLTKLNVPLAANFCAYRDAVNAIVRSEMVCWVMCARFLGVAKDVRLIVCRILWASRKGGRVLRV